MEMENQDMESWRIRKQLQFLREAKGDGTSMITLVIPPKEQISRVNKMLAEELGAANNIKSRLNRTSVTSALVSTQQKLKLYKQIPTNGLAIFCGTVIQDNKTRQVIYDIEPYRPVTYSVYLCDNRFHTDALEEVLESNERYAFIIVDGNGCLFAVLSGRNKQILHQFGVDLPKKHRRGGQSALRFSRLRTEKRHNYVRKVAEMSAQLYLSNDRPNVSRLILAGTADFKTEIGNSELLDPRLRSIILDVVDISYGGEQGLNQAIDMCSESLSGVKFIKEKKIIQEFFDEISKDSGKYCFGVEETMKSLESGILETMIIYEDLDLLRCVTKNSETNELQVKYQAPLRNPHEDYNRSGPSHETSIDENREESIIERQPLVDWLVENYTIYGASLVLVSNKSQEGAQFHKGFGGVGGILRYETNLYHEELEFFSEDEEDEEEFI